MRFRPCIDIHNGKVKQIVGSSLQDEGNTAKENFVSEYDGAAFARMYKAAGLHGGHIILLNPAGASTTKRTAIRQSWRLRNIREGCRSAAESMPRMPDGFLIWEHPM